MKDQILREILYKIKSRPDLKKKLKIAILVGVVGFFLTAGLVIWAAVSAVSYFGNQLQTTNVNGAVESLQTNIKNIPAVNALGCWQQAQNMMAIEPWLIRSLAQNLNLLKDSCLRASPEECKTEECKKNEQEKSGQWG
jgi:hypothetical protein